jgi:lipoprotein-anchoring transpeptidase ErfK/SrfK
VTDRTKSLEVHNAAGQTIFFAPVTIGSLRDPLPVGEWKVNGVIENPTFNYNPDLFWDAEPSHAKAKIAAGPNNPVGLVWIDLSKEHYGIHGSPEPSRIGYTESHGCIRLTNWDAMRLAALVAPGTKVVLQ